IEKVRTQSFDLVLMDNRMLNVSGLQALDEMKNLDITTPIIIMTAYSSIEIAVEAIKKGAYDYLTKPLDFDKLRLILKRALEHVQLKAENRLLKERLGKQFDDQRIIGRSPVMLKLLETVAQVAPTEATVLISGESGTGKEQIAGAVHFNSPRKTNPFITVNCAAITETLLESELFGHEKGSFTGADRRKDGRFLQANGGSLFLDEIGEMPLSMQAKLLRVLQEKELTRVGGEKVIKVDARIIAATNRDLAEMVKAGTFREDLYYRLNVVALEVPPLRERKEDIHLLAQHFLTMFSTQNHKMIKGFSPGTLDFMMNYQWPGNVRELMNAVERAVVLSREEYLSRESFLNPQQQNSAVEKEVIDIESQKIQPLEQVERTAILAALEATDGNKSETARKLGITRRTLHQKLKKYGVMP
ncbi:sigma-54 dependent transcriptional regulator, partial [bacterium]|nr:sigma-54 dependent transcriptional regulator [bacterium]